MAGNAQGDLRLSRALHAPFFSLVVIAISGAQQPAIGKTFLVNFVPGHSHWLGQTAFKNGIIVSDEIMIYRTVSLSSAEVGNVSGIFHEYTLQSLSPQPSDGSNIPI